MMPYYLLRPEPLNALRRGIPVGEATRAIQHEDRDVLDALDQLSEGLRGFAGGGNGGHYAFRQHDDKYARAYISCKPWQRRAPVAAPQHWKPAWRMTRGAARTRAPRPVHHIRARRESPLFRRVRLRGQGPRGAGIRGRAPPARIRPGRRQQRGLPRLRFPRTQPAPHHRWDRVARRAEP